MSLAHLIGRTCRQLSAGLGWVSRLEDRVRVGRRRVRIRVLGGSIVRSSSEEFRAVILVLSILASLLKRVDLCSKVGKILAKSFHSLKSLFLLLGDDLLAS